MAKFTVGEAIGYGWDSTKANATFLVTYTGVLLAAAILLGGAEGNWSTTGYHGNLLSTVAALVLGMYMTKAALRIVDGEQVGWRNAFQGISWKQFGNYLLGAILTYLATIVGFVLLIVPGIIVAVALSMFPYVIWDKDMGAIDSMKESWKITQGSRLDLFFPSLLLGIIMLVSAIPFGLGLLVTLPITVMASLYAYRKLEPKA